MTITPNTSPTALMNWLGPEANIINAMRCRTNLCAAGWSGFDILDIPKDVFIEAAFRNPSRMDAE